MNNIDISSRYSYVSDFRDTSTASGIFIRPFFPVCQTDPRTKKAIEIGTDLLKKVQENPQYKV